MDTVDLKQAQNVQLEIAKEIKRVCENNNIRYFLDAGTLLGAVRHKGYIPWDDDFDMGMMIDDYLKFIKIAGHELSKEFFIQSWENDFYYPAPYIKVKKKGTIYREKRSSKYIKDGVWVDVFPYMNFDGDFFEANKIAKKLMVIYRILLMKCKYRPWQEEKGINKKKYLAYIPFNIFSMIISKDKLISIYKKIIKQSVIGDADSKYLYYVCAEPKEYLIEKKWYDEYVNLKFEDEMFSCPIGYKNVLKALYGDYMILPPIEERENRHLISNSKF